MRFRNYAPNLGRWLERDPAGYKDGYLLMAYARSSPIGRQDPLGLESCDKCDEGNGRLMNGDDYKEGEGGQNLTLYDGSSTDPSKLDRVERLFKDGFDTMSLINMLGNVGGAGKSIASLLGRLKGKTVKEIAKWLTEQGIEAGAGGVNDALDLAANLHDAIKNLRDDMMRIKGAYIWTQVGTEKCVCKKTLLGAGPEKCSWERSMKWHKCSRAENPLVPDQFFPNDVDRAILSDCRKQAFEAAKNEMDEGKKKGGK